MLTPFGVTLRKLRLDKQMRLLDLAEKLGRTSSYVSAIETGKKPIPRGYVAEVAHAMKLTAAQRDELQRAADRTRRDLSVGDLSESKREFVAEFARRVQTMDDFDLDDLKKKIFPSDGSTPFRRRRRGMLVASASYEKLWGYADQIRSVLVKDDETEFPIAEVLEFKLPRFFDGFCLSICDYDEMNGDEGNAIPQHNMIELRRDVYEGAWRGYGRHRFTLAHELGHFLMHRNVGLSRASDDFPIYRDAEWQADTFAGGLLFSRQHISRFSDADEVATGCGMTFDAAEVMWSKYVKEGYIAE